MSADRITEFVISQLSGDLLEVPGIGPAAVKALANHDVPESRITTTYQLIGAYLSFKGRSESDGEIIAPISHNDLFWYFLKERGISSHRSAIVQAIAMKCNSFMQGLYDPAAYESDEEDDDDDFENN